MPLSESIVDVFMRPIRDADAYILYADIGRNYIDFTYPRAINVGISETTMVGMACGLASEGHKVYTFCLTPHILRAWEFVRTILVPKKYNVVVCGGGSGEDYASLGHSQQMPPQEMVLYCRASGIRYIKPHDRADLDGALRQHGPLFLHIPNSVREK